MINLETITQKIWQGETEQIQAKIIADSLCLENGARLTTFELVYPRCILAEMNTHRIASRNTGSSRAIPLKKTLQFVKDSPFIPMFWGKNKAGMQSSEEITGLKLLWAKLLWAMHRSFTLWIVNQLGKVDLHKQWANRLLEPHSYVKQVFSATSFENFFELRIDDAAQPEIVALAIKMKEAMEQSVPREVSVLTGGDSVYDWHLPYVTKQERQIYFDNPIFLAKISAARCARTSYLTQDGQKPNHEKELATFYKLVGSEPKHWSPCEHQAFPLNSDSGQSRNYQGFLQFREYYEECLFENDQS